MTFQVIDNIEVPAAAVRARSKARSPLTVALDGLNVGQGFVFDDARELKKLYATVAPAKFPAGPGINKKFQLWQDSEGKIGVKRLADVAVTERKAKAPAEAAAE